MLKDGSHLTVIELKKEAKERGIQGFSKMNRLELCKTLGYRESKRATKSTTKPSKAPNVSKNTGAKTTTTKKISPKTQSKATKEKAKAAPKIKTTQPRSKATKEKPKAPQPKTSPKSKVTEEKPRAETQDKNQPTKPKKRVVKKQATNKEGKDLESVKAYYWNGNLKSETWFGDNENKVREILYHDDGSKKSETFFNTKEQVHRDSAPAYTTWFRNGFLESESWYKNGKPHREDGPAKETWRKTGKRMASYWYYNGIQVEKPESGVIQTKPKKAYEPPPQDRINFEKDIVKMSMELFGATPINPSALKAINEILIYVFDSIAQKLLETGTKIYSEEDVEEACDKILYGGLKTGIKDHYFVFTPQNEWVQAKVHSIEGAAIKIFFNVVEYIAAQIIEICILITKRKNVHIITPTILKAAIQNENDLNKMFGFLFA